MGSREGKKAQDSVLKLSAKRPSTSQSPNAPGQDSKTEPLDLPWHQVEPCAPVGQTGVSSCITASHGVGLVQPHSKTVQVLEAVRLRWDPVQHQPREPRDCLYHLSPNIGEHSKEQLSSHQGLGQESEHRTVLETRARQVKPNTGQILTVPVLRSVPMAQPLDPSWYQAMNPVHWNSILASITCGWLYWTQAMSLPQLQASHSNVDLGSVPVLCWSFQLWAQGMTQHCGIGGHGTAHLIPPLSQAAQHR